MYEDKKKKNIISRTVRTPIESIQYIRFLIFKTVMQKFNLLFSLVKVSGSTKKKYCKLLRDITNRDLIFNGEEVHVLQQNC